ncbi:twin-arginine translocase TatA/TatE family subunit [Halobium palmae]|uniref:Sec-independent protein translocase protein TatA n=1 Tax=Halobium palmae TaxID=1776492 RepID=A0ABD5RXE5_9EURY
MLSTLPLFGAIPGGPEMLIILLIVVLLFGANKLPKLARSTGQAMGEFQKGRNQIEEELQEMEEDTKEAVTGDSPTSSTSTESTSTSTSTAETEAESSN